MKKTSGINKSHDARGFTLKNRISKNELKVFREAINKQWFQRIKGSSPEIADEIINKKITIENYHQISMIEFHLKLFLCLQIYVECM